MGQKGDTADHASALQLFGQQIGDNDLRRIFDYWNGRRGSRWIPDRSVIDVADIAPSQWARLGLIEVHAPEESGGLRRYRWRLVGGWWGQVFKVELTGRWAHEVLSGAVMTLVQGSYDWVVDHRFPLHVRRRGVIEERLLVYEAIMAPMSIDGADDVGMILAAGAPLPDRYADDPGVDDLASFR